MPQRPSVCQKSLNSSNHTRYRCCVSENASWAGRTRHQSKHLIVIDVEETRLHMEGTWPLKSRSFGLCKTSTPAMQTGGRQLLDDYTTSPLGTHTRRIPQSLKMCNLHSTFQTMVPRSCGQGLGHAHAMSHCEVLLDGSGGTDGYWTDPANAWLLEEVRRYYFKALFEKCWARLFAFWTRVCIIT